MNNAHLRWLYKQSFFQTMMDLQCLMLWVLCLAWIKRIFNSRSGPERILPIYHLVVYQTIWFINQMLQNRLDTLAITFWRSSASVYILYSMQFIQTILLMNEELSMHSLNLNLMKLSDHLFISQVETPSAKSTTNFTE